MSAKSSVFAIECPKCGQYAAAKKGWFSGIASMFGEKTGLFGTKQIECACGHLVDVKTESLVTRECPDCGNVVAYDQAQADTAVCPVCKSRSVSAARVGNIKMADFLCSQCGASLRVQQDTRTHECPICEKYIDDVQKLIYQLDVSRSGMASVIKYEGDNETFVWKHPIEDFNIGSQLIVHETQEAVFFRDGQALDSFGAGRYTLETASIPLINNLYNSQLEPTSMFHSEVYFVNMTVQPGIKWGVGGVRFLEPHTGIPLEIGASGEFSLRVADPRTLLLEIVGTGGGLDRSQLLSLGVQNDDGTIAAGSGGGGMKGFFRALIITRVKTLLAKTIREAMINILEIDEQLDALSDALRTRINEGLAAYGLVLPELYVTNVATPDDDKNFAEMKQLHAEQYLRVRTEQVRKVEAEAALDRMTVEQRTAAQMRIIEAQGTAEANRIQAQADADAHRMMAEAQAAEMQMKGYTYDAETRRQIGLEAVKGGIVKEGGGGAVGGVAGLGVELATIGAVMGLTRDAIGSVAGLSSEIGQSVGGVVNPPALSPQMPLQGPATWDCACGEGGISKNFCPQCGAKKPQPPQVWTCACGEADIAKNFCPNCGAKRPDPPATWDCACGEGGNTKNFCADCGAPKPTPPATWDCACGNTAIAKKFCDDCGSKSPGGA